MLLCLPMMYAVYWVYDTGVLTSRTCCRFCLRIHIILEAQVGTHQVPGSHAGL